MLHTRKFVNPPEHLSQCPVEHDGSEQLIRFLCEPGVINSIPHPVKAGEMLPRWYKQLPAIIADQKPTEGNVTVKGCFPFVDAMTSGYIIPLWCDVYVEQVAVTGSNGEPDSVGPKFSWNADTGDGKAVIDSHGTKQTEGVPVMERAVADYALKFNNPWIIETPPGFSCYFLPPINQDNGDLFHVFSAEVDTDTYFSKINFPFAWLKKGYEGILEKGTPLIQVIPFRRERFGLEIGGFTEEDRKRFRNTQHAVASVYKGGYRDHFRDKVKQ